MNLGKQELGDSGKLEPEVGREPTSLRDPLGCLFNNARVLSYSQPSVTRLRANPIWTLDSWVGLPEPG
jgi:hypothetical protein